jgi:hypothetical protein
MTERNIDYAWSGMDDQDEDYDDGYDLDDEHEFGCCFPGECLHPSYDHLKSECFTAAMAEAWAADEMNVAR